jgi:hypothetical protein
MKLGLGVVVGDAELLGDGVVGGLHVGGVVEELMGEFGAGFGELVHESAGEEARGFGDTEFNAGPGGMVQAVQQVVVPGWQ